MMKRLGDKIDQLDSLHKKHLDRPTLDDLNKEEAQIQSLTRDISEVWMIFEIVFLGEINR